MGYGVGMGWLSTALPLLQSDDTPLETGPITTEQLSWAGSIISIGALLGNFSFGYLTNVIGSKNAVLILGVPQMVKTHFSSFFLWFRAKEWENNENFIFFLL